MALHRVSRCRGPAGHARGLWTTGLQASRSLRTIIQRRCMGSTSRFWKNYKIFLFYSNSVVRNYIKINIIRYMYIMIDTVFATKTEL